MNAIFINSENSITSKAHDLRMVEKIIASLNLSIYCTWENIKSSYNSNKFKISATTWNDKFELPDRLYSVSDIQD